MPLSMSMTSRVAPTIHGSMARSKYQCGDGGTLRAGLHGNRRHGQPWLTERGHTTQSGSIM